MSVNPLNITDEGGLFESVTARIIDIEHDFVIEAAKLLGRDDIRELWARDPAAARSLLREALDGVVKSRLGEKARRELNEDYNALMEDGLLRDERIYEWAYEKGLLAARPVPLGASEGIRRTLREGYRKVRDVLDRVALTGRNDVVETLTGLMTEAAEGSETIDAVIRRGMERMTEMGITGHVYPSGARISMAPYVRRELVTNMMNVTRELGFERAKDWGSDLIQVSAHAGARPRCFPFQGGVYSVRGTHAKYRPFGSTSYGEPAGLFGINCRHFFWPFFEGLNDEYTADQRDPARLLGGPTNDQVYVATQEQRYNERQIRKWKLRRDGLRALNADSTRADESVKRWQARQRRFIKNCQSRGVDLRRDYLREKA